MTHAQNTNKQTNIKISAQTHGLIVNGYPNKYLQKFKTIFVIKNNMTSMRQTMLK